MTAEQSDRPRVSPSSRAPLLWGVVVGAVQAASPYAFWWLDPATVYALGLILIAAVYIGPDRARSQSSSVAARCFSNQWSAYVSSLKGGTST